MFRLITFFISILGFAAMVWFGVTVELGERTLFGHLRAIGSSSEAKQLGDGIKEKVTDFVGIEAAKRAEAAKEALRKAGEGGDDAAAGKAGKAATPSRPIAKAPAVERAPADRPKGTGRRDEEPASKPR